MDKFEVGRSSRRPRARCNGPFSCSVDGCRSDLSRCRDYHRRHKVCEAHSKTPTVTVGGQEMRFCQQCSRFHSLAEFDGEKRSCRKRLDGHNRRRRKPRPESSIPNHTWFLSTHQGARHLPFGPPQACPALMDSNCASGNGALSLLSLPLPQETHEVGFKNYMVQLPRPHFSIPPTLYCDDLLLQSQSRGSFSMQDCSNKVVNKSSFQPVALDRFIR